MSAASYLYSTFTYKIPVIFVKKILILIRFCVQLVRKTYCYRDGTPKLAFCSEYKLIYLNILFMHRITFKLKLKAKFN